MARARAAARRGMAKNAPRMWPRRGGKHVNIAKHITIKYLSLLCFRKCFSIGPRDSREQPHRPIPSPSMASWRNASHDWWSIAALTASLLLSLSSSLPFYWMRQQIYINFPSHTWRMRNVRHAMPPRQGNGNRLRWFVWSDRIYLDFASCYLHAIV